MIPSTERLTTWVHELAPPPPPNVEQFKKEIDELIEEVNNNTTPVTPKTKHHYQTDEELRIASLNFALDYVLRVKPSPNLKSTHEYNHDKFIATHLYVTILNFTVQNSCRLFGIFRGTYYQKVEKQLTASQRFIQKEILDRYNQLVEYFTETIHREIKNPVTVTYKSKV